MKESDLHDVRISARLLVLQMAAQELLIAVAASSPAARQSLVAKVSEWRRNAAAVRLPDAAAQYSDLFAAEFQDMLDEFLQPVEKRLKD